MGDTTRDEFLSAVSSFMKKRSLMSHFFDNVSSNPEKEKPSSSGWNLLLKKIGHCDTFCDNLKEFIATVYAAELHGLKSAKEKDVPGNWSEKMVDKPDRNFIMKVLEEEKNTVAAVIATKVEKYLEELNKIIEVVGCKDVCDILKNSHSINLSDVDVEILQTNVINVNPTFSLLCPNALSKLVYI